MSNSRGTGSVHVRETSRTEFDGFCLGGIELQLDWVVREMRRCFPEIKIPARTARPDIIR